MNKLLLYLMQLFFITFSYGQEVITKRFNSDVLNNHRIIKIYTPQGYEVDSAKFYPLAVVFDAEYMFDVYVGNSVLFSKKDKAPEQIVVGIFQNQYEERYEDCSYSKEDSMPTANGDAFYRFVRDELIGYMEENYRVSPFKTAVGNTLTGNFTNYFVLDSYPVFNAVVNINSYYAPDMPYFLQNRIPNLKDEVLYYYSCNGDYNSEGRKNTIMQTDTILQSYKSDMFRYKYDHFENSTRISSIGQGIAGSLAHIFEIYSAISKEEFENNIKDLSPADAIAYLEKKYIEIDYFFGGNLKIRERDIFAVESIILDKENGDYLKSFGEMINRLYKESALGDYYIGMYYETGKKYKMALRYYKDGYMKLPKGDPNADGYYQNIERVLKKRDGTYVEPEQIKN